MSVQSYADRNASVAPLGAVLPLDTPLSLMVDPSNACNFKCVFCPTGDAELLKQVGRPKGAMKLDLFAKIVADLSEFSRPIGVLHLYKDGEPLANKHLATMIRLAKESGRVGRVETTSNGSLLAADRAEELIAAGLDGIRISVYGLSNESYAANTQTKTELETVRSNVEFLFRRKNELGSSLRIHAKIIDTGLNTAERARFLDLFGPISDSVHIDSIMGWSSTGPRDMTLGLSPATGMSSDKPLQQERAVCAEPFMKMAVNFNGEVSVCCVDWAHDTVVGDVRSESLLSIWTGPRLRAFRLKHLAGQRSSLKACSTCHYVQGLPASRDLDEAAHRLLPLYSG